MISHRWLIDNLEAELAKFDDSVYSLPEYRIRAFKSCVKLLSDDTNFAGLSKGRRKSLKHARTVLKDVFQGIGPEVFILCCMSTSISRLANTSHDSLIPDLRKWWKPIDPPQGLVGSAKELCESYSVGSLITASEEHQSPKSRAQKSKTLRSVTS